MEDVSNEFEENEVPVVQGRIEPGEGPTPKMEGGEGLFDPVEIEEQVADGLGTVIFDKKQDVSVDEVTGELVFSYLKDEDVAEFDAWLETLIDKIKEET